MMNLARDQAFSILRLYYQTQYPVIVMSYRAKKSYLGKKTQLGTYFFYM